MVSISFSRAGDSCVYALPGGAHVLTVMDGAKSRGEVMATVGPQAELYRGALHGPGAFECQGQRCVKCSSGPPCTGDIPLILGPRAPLAWFAMAPSMDGSMIVLDPTLDERAIENLLSKTLESNEPAVEFHLYHLRMSVGASGSLVGKVVAVPVLHST